MKSALLRFGVLLSLVVAGMAQMRSTISAGPIHIGRPHPPGIFRQPDFGRRFHGNGLGTIIYPYGMYDGFYDTGYREVVEQPAPPVVIVRDVSAGPAAPVQVAPADPKVIDVPEPIVVSSKVARTPTAIFILSDGRRLESQNYTITDTTLTIQEPHRSAMQVPLDRLNLEATQLENHKRGLDLQFPEGRSEILISF
jgi:hypothetical protein